MGLIEAIKTGQLSLVKKALDRNLELDSLDPEGLTPLYIAAKEGYPDIVVELLDRGFEVNEVTRNSYKDTSLLIAIEKGHTDVCNILIERGADLNKVGGYTKTTPAWVATAFNQPDILNILIERGVDLNQADASGQTPIWMSVIRNNTEILRILLEQGLSANYINIESYSDSLLCVASVGSDHECIVKQLIDHRADLDHQGCNGNAPLHSAAQRGYVNIVEMLISAKANINATNIFGETPFLLAAQHKRIKVMKMLIQQQHLDLHCSANGRENAVWRAAMKGHYSVIKILAKAGADLNKANYCNKKPVDIAAEKNNLGALAFLALYGANLDENQFKLAFVWMLGNNNLPMAINLLDLIKNKFNDLLLFMELINWLHSVPQCWDDFVVSMQFCYSNKYNLPEELNSKILSFKYGKYDNLATCGVINSCQKSVYSAIALKHFEKSYSSNKCKYNLTLN